LLVERDYQVRTQAGLPLFLNGLCESSHGLGDAGSFSLLSLRASEILQSLKRYFAQHDPAIQSEVAKRASAVQPEAVKHTPPAQPETIYAHHNV
jgi:L-ornithine N5-oxygenase